MVIPQFVDKSLLPHKPGVYVFKDKNSRVIYVGKAIDLYHRVVSYFRSNQDSHDPKTRALVEDIKKAETIIVQSELEALILEANLIKKYLPKYNIRLTDDKDYLYIKVTKEEFPKIITARKSELSGSLKYFGPFPSSKTVRDTLKVLRRIFPWCSNPPKSTIPPERWQAKPRACFYYHISQCPGACVNKISQEDYRKIINSFIKFMEGKKEVLTQELIQEMEQKSKEQHFEEAARIKKILAGINYLTQSNRVQVYLENPNFLEDQSKLALKELQKALKLKNYPSRIEAYDISNTGGKEATGSMVVLTEGEIDKREYRKFKIFISGRPNDVGMHKEMMARRLNHLEWSLPDLIIVDGGRGQARAVEFQILNFKFPIPVYGLAKRMEWLYPPEGEIIKLPKRSLSLKLLQKLRDEAHRFAIIYHKKLRAVESFS